MASMPPSGSAIDPATRGRPTRLASSVAQSLPRAWFHPITARLNRRAEPEMRLVVERCDPAGRALDVGAWYGPWTYWLSRRVDRVDAFEPNPAVAAALRAGVRANVTVRETAASDRTGRAELVLPTAGVGSEGTASIVPGTDGAVRYAVATERIDDHGFDDVTFVKIDVEGHEQAVLVGAARTIEASHPVLFVELDARHGDVDATIRHLTELGYEGRVLVDGAWRDVTTFDLPGWQRRFHEAHTTQSYLQTVISPDGYVNDVAFVHPRSTWSPW